MGAPFNSVDGATVNAGLSAGILLTYTAPSSDGLATGGMTFFLRSERRENSSYSRENYIRNSVNELPTVLH